MASWLQLLFLFKIFPVFILIFDQNVIFEQDQDFVRPISVAPSLMDVSYGVTRRPRTPQEVLPSRVHKTSGSSEYSDDGKMQTDNSKPVDLIISNLDPSINIKELRKMLTNLLKDYAMVLSQFL